MAREEGVVALPLQTVRAQVLFQPGAQRLGHEELRIRGQQRLAHHEGEALDECCNTRMNARSRLEWLELRVVSRISCRSGPALGIHRRGRCIDEARRPPPGAPALLLGCFAVEQKKN